MSFIKSMCKRVIGFQIIFFLGLFPQIALAAAPATPSAPTVTATGTSSFSISWSSVSTATQYKLYRATSSGGAYSQIYWGANLSYTDSGSHLSSNTTYYYKLTAGNSSNVYSGYSSVASGTTWMPTPSTPSTPTVSATGSSSISISWSSVSNATLYKLYRATSSGGSYSQIYYSSATSYTDSGSHLSASTTYYYKLMAGNSTSWSGYSSVASATTWASIPSAPSTPTVSATGASSISISWNSVGGASTYKLYRATSSNGSYTQIYYAATPSYTDSGSHLSASTTYYYKVTAGNSSGDSSYSSVGSATTWAPIPAIPSAPTVTATGTTSFDISWTSVNGATAYQVYRATSLTGTYKQIAWPTTNSYTDSGTHLSASTTYYYQIKAGNGTGYSDFSSAGSGTTWADIPAIPSAPTVTTTGSTSFDISWTAVSGATAYQLYRSPSLNGTYLQIAWPTTTSYTDSGTHLSANTTYYYKLKAGNTTGYSADSSITSATTWVETPSAPTVTTTGTTSFDISWTAVSGATAYQLYRSPSLNGSYLQIAWPTTTSYTDSGTHLSANTTYYYKLKAGNSNGYSADSSITSGTTWPDIPATPSAPTVTATGPTSFDISWTAVSGATAYQLYRSTSLNGTYLKMAWPTTNSYTDSGTHLSANTTYYYKLNAGNTTGYSADSSVTSGTTWPDIPAIPSAPTVTATGASSFNISWTAVNGATAYQLYRSTSLNGTYLKMAWPTTNSYTDSGTHLSANTTYYYKLNAGNTTGYSADSSVTSGTTWPDIPAIPSAPTVTATGASSFNISWTAVNGATAYQVYRSTSLNGTYLQIAWPTTNSYTDSGTHLSASTTYYYQIKAGNGTGYSDFSSAGSDTTWVAIPAIPSAPTVTATSSSSFNISWTAVSGATAYQVYRSTSLNGYYLQMAWPTTNSYTDSGTHLSANTTYYYRIKAGNSTGYSDYSSVGSGTTWAPIPAIPSAPTVTATSSSSFNISWTAVSGATVYKLYRATSLTGSYAQIGSSMTTASYTDSGSSLSASTTYYYKVKAGSSGGYSDFSSAGSGTTLTPIPSVPSRPTVTATGPNSINISWSTVSGATTYKVYRSTTSSGGSSSYIEIAESTSTSYTDSGTQLSASTTYYYKVKSGSSGGYSAFSTSASAKTWVAIPATPSAPTVTATSSTSLDISWSAVTNATEYKVYRATTSGGTFSEVYSGANLTYTDSSASANTTYYYTIKAGNTSGWSDYSAEGSDSTSVTLARQSSATRMFVLPFDSNTATNILKYPNLGNDPCTNATYVTYTGHEGTDYGMSENTQIYAAASGTVSLIHTETCSTPICYGNYLAIDHGNGISTLYAHLNSYLVSLGDTVQQGDPIALSGMTGTDTPHLHFEVLTDVTTSPIYGTPNNPYFCDDEWFTTSPPTNAQTQAAVCDATSPVASQLFCADVESITGTADGGGTLGNVLELSLSLNGTKGTFTASKPGVELTSTFSTSGQVDLKVGGSGAEYLSRDSKPICGEDMSETNRSANCGTTNATLEVAFAEDDFGCYDITTFPTEYYARYQTNPDIGYAIAGPIKVDALFDFNSGLTAPENLTVVGTGPNSIDISWSAVSGATEYRLCRSASPTANEGYTQIDWDSPVSYSDSSYLLTPATTYYYKVAAGNVDGWSNFSAVTFGSTTSQ